MIASVSTLARSSGATSPSRRVNFSMLLLLFGLLFYLAAELLQILAEPFHGIAPGKRQNAHHRQQDEITLDHGCSLQPVLETRAHIDEPPGDGRPRSHRRAHEVGASAGALPSLEIPV